MRILQRKPMLRPLRGLLLLLLLMAFTSACNTTMPIFSPYAFQSAISLKVDALYLVDKSSEPFENHKERVEDLKFLKLEVVPDTRVKIVMQAIAEKTR